MIFLTVGTHEQSFDRLIKYVDELKINNILDEEIIIQTGFSAYIPKCCQYKKLYSYNEMEELIRKARIVITHGAPASFLMSLKFKKIPIVVPRRKEFNEHVNNHQVEFTHEVAKRKQNIIVVDEIDKLYESIINYEKIIADMTNKFDGNNKKFCEEFELLINKMFSGSANEQK